MHTKKILDMSLQFGTVKSISAPRIRKPQPPRPPLTTEQREDKRKVHEEREAHINAKVQEWISYTLNLAEELGKEFEKKPRYFLLAEVAKIIAASKGVHRVF